MRYLAVAAVLAVGLAAHSAAAAMVYRWTDERGVVHFSDVPPPHAPQMRAQTLPDPPPNVAAPPGDAAATDLGDGRVPTGPARVVVTDHQEAGAGAGAQSFHGKVKNEGGAEARGVYVALVVTEPNQGQECLHEDVDVQPAILAPGAEGTFEAQFDNPCFHGPTNAELRPEWR